jgi:hypothetical protein
VLANLSLNTPISQATLYTFRPSLTRGKSFKNPKSIKLQIPDYPLVLELVPKGAKPKEKKPG